MKNNELNNHSKKIIIFHISSKGDTKCSYSCFIDNGLNILSTDYQFRVIKINNILKRLVLLFLISSLKILGLNNRFSIWEPSPNWLKRLFYYRNINLNIFKSKGNFESLYLNKILKKELNSKFLSSINFNIKNRKKIGNSLDIFYPNKKVKNLKSLII